MNDQNVSLEYLGITEAAEYLRVSASTLRRWEKKGFLIPERTPTGIRRYTKSQLDDVLQQSVPLDSDLDNQGYSNAQEPVYVEQDVAPLPPTFDSYDSMPISNVDMNNIQQPVEQSGIYPNNYSDQLNSQPFEISSHRHAPPPQYNRVVSEPMSYDFTSFSSINVQIPTDPVQESIDKLSKQETEFVTEYYPSFDQATQIAQPSIPVTYAENEYEYYADEVQATPNVETTPPKQHETKKVSGKKSSGVALFMGVFVGILLLTASVWFGYVYLSGGFSTQALLSPVP